MSPDDSALDNLPPPDKSIIRRTMSTDEEAKNVALSLADSGKKFSIQGPAKESVADDSALDNLPPPSPTTSVMEDIKQGIGNLAAGAVRGAGSIGATILTPIDAATRVLNHGEPLNVGGYDVLGQDRRSGMDAALTNMGADTNSLAFQGGKLGAEVAGTAGAGGILGAGAKMLGATPKIVSAFSSGGMSLGGKTTGSLIGDLALRSGAGAATGMTAAGMVNPSSAGTGAVIGAATPGGAWLAGLAGHSVTNLAGKVTKSILGGTTGTGSSVIDAAYNAGLEGDSSFLANMRGDANFSDIVDQAKDALSVMRETRGQTYRTGMAAVSGDKTILDIQPIQDAIKTAQGKFASYHGEVTNENANSAIQRVSEKVNDWATKDPTIFHTPEGLDKLKQWVGGELENAKPGTQTDAALKGIYNSIKSTVAAQAPTYAKTMADYETASEQLSEITRSLSLGQKTSADTAIRKLQSVLRNNVNTNFGNRTELVNALEQQGGARIVPAVAGQSLNSVWPRGMAAPTDAIALAAASLHNPMLLGAAAAASPRLVGEATYGAGRLAGVGRTALNSIPGPGYIPLNRIAPLLGTQNAPLPSWLNQSKARPLTNP